MNIFQYAAIEEMNFEAQAAQSGYKRITTFYSDLSLAEAFGANGIKDTFKNVCREWLNNYKFFTEFVICLNWKSWAMYERGKSELSELYAELYYKAQNMFYEHYKDDKVAQSYYFEMTD